MDFADTRHFLCDVDGGIATIRLDRPERKNPLTFDSLCRAARLVPGAALLRRRTRGGVLPRMAAIFHPAVMCMTLSGRSRRWSMKDLLQFTRMTGDLVKAMINCGKPIIAAIDGICVGAGAIIAMASDMRFATPEAKTAFLFTRVGLAGCDMGACSILPRIIGQDARR